MSYIAECCHYAVVQKYLYKLGGGIPLVLSLAEIAQDVSVVNSFAIGFTHDNFQAEVEMLPSLLMRDASEKHFFAHRVG